MRIRFECLDMVDAQLFDDGMDRPVNKKRTTDVMFISYRCCYLSI